MIWYFDVKAMRVLFVLFQVNVCLYIGLLQHFRISNISGRSSYTRLFSSRGSFIHLFSDAVTMLQFQVSLFSIIFIY